jgi:hypothetical protein
MKSRSVILLFIILLNACNQEKAIQTCTYTKVEEGKCIADTSNSYHFILPEQHKGKIPLLLVLDSGGDGLLAIEKMAPAVSLMPCIVMGSDLIRNNYPAYIQAIGDLIHEAFQKFPVSSDRIIIAGFSGGARMAFEYARQHPVQGVLMCGAGPDGTSFANLPCPVYMIAGTTDFNFSEMYYDPLMNSAHPGFLSDYFRGSHEWPPTENLKQGLLFLLGNSFPNREELFRHESASLSEKADSLIEKGETLFAVKAVEKALRFQLHNKRARQQMQKIRNISKSAGDFKKIQSDLDMESRIKQAYFDASMKKDSLWWANEIRQLTLETNSSTGDKKDHFMRIKGFMGILFYSKLNSLLHSQPANKQILHLLSAYRLIEPRNPDVYYYRALYALKQGNEQLSRKELSLALSLGFSDRVRLEKDFPRSMLNHSM